MPVSTRDVLDDENFFPVRAAMREIEAAHGGLMPEPGFRTKRPASYYRLASRDQRVGFIGAMTDFHFCESCNKMRSRATEAATVPWESPRVRPARTAAGRRDGRRAARDVPRRGRAEAKEHDFRGAYAPGRRMVAIGG